MGNDVFFYNDKSGRVERLPYSLDTNNSYNSSLVDSVFTSDAQMAHDWGRRPRSKYSSRSRPITPVQVSIKLLVTPLITATTPDIPRPSPGRTQCPWMTSARTSFTGPPSRHRCDPGPSQDAAGTG